MPCNDGGPSYDQIAAQNIRNQENERKAKEYDSLKRRLDLVTRLLCSVMQTIEADDKSFTRLEGDATLKELKDWWVKHKKLDIHRKKRELVQAEIKKLNKKMADLQKWLKEDEE